MCGSVCLLVSGTKLGKTHWSALPFRDFSSILVSPVKLLEDWLWLPFHLACQGGQFPQSISALPPSYYFGLFPSLCGTNNITKARSLRSCQYLISNHFLHLGYTYIQIIIQYNHRTHFLMYIWLEYDWSSIFASYLDITTSPMPVWIGNYYCT